MTQAQLAIIPIPEGRKAERRVVNLAARLRDPGSRLIEEEIVNLSTTGFMARGAEIEVGALVWLKLAGLEPQSCKVVWNDDGKAGFEFVNPLHVATIEQILVANRKPRLKNYFGPKGVCKSVPH